MHRYHPDPTRDDPSREETILWDDCERCASHTANPFASLDDANLARLYAMTLEWMADEGPGPATHNQTQAQRVMETHIRQTRRLNQITQLDTRMP